MVNQNVQMYAGDSGGGRHAANVIYYRNRRGWITWGDTQASIQLDMIRSKGCIPLPQYGHITHSEDLWGPILRHPEGPAEFPVEQVLIYRWYDKRRLPDLRLIQQVGRDYQRVGTQPVIRFPQLKGVKITEYPCPESCLVTLPGGISVDKAYHNPIHLGNHLRVMHGYDRSEIIKYGEAMGIDFSRVPGGRELVQYDFTEVEAVAEEVVQDAEEVFEVAQVSPESPATEEIRASIEVQLDCPDCGWVNDKNTEQGLAMHKRRWCKMVAV